ncbi:hypothetical protein SMICM304S_05736 [Streptomyces microflavus]
MTEQSQKSRCTPPDFPVTVAHRQQALYARRRECPDDLATPTIVPTPPNDLARPHDHLDGGLQPGPLRSKWRQWPPHPPLDRGRQALDSAPALTSGDLRQPLPCSRHAFAGLAAIARPRDGPNPDGAQDQAAPRPERWRRGSSTGVARASRPSAGAKESLDPVCSCSPEMDAAAGTSKPPNLRAANCFNSRRRGRLHRQQPLHDPRGRGLSGLSSIWQALQWCGADRSATGADHRRHRGRGGRLGHPRPPRLLRRTSAPRRCARIQPPAAAATVPVSRRHILGTTEGCCGSSHISTCNMHTIRLMHRGYTCTHTHTHTHTRAAIEPLLTR